MNNGMLTGFNGINVLIETLWNVKEEIDILIFLTNSRINRNIVECKVFLTRFLFVSSNSINRNIVECKEAIKLTLNPFPFCINRNIVECKV